jgi:hypothetical protein
MPASIPVRSAVTPGHLLPLRPNRKTLDPVRPSVDSRKLSAMECFLPVYRCGTQNRTDFRNAALLAMPSQAVGLSSST